MTINIPKQELIDYYITKKLSLYEIAKIYNCNHNTIRNKMIKYNIPIRTISESHIGISSGMLGKRHTEESKKKMSKFQKRKFGKENNSWKGNKVGRVALHQYIRKYKPEPEYCTICNQYGKKLECCSIDHTYTRNSDDYIYLCHSCHKLFDKCRKELKEGIKL